jgi:hypothetical protein
MRRRTFDTIMSAGGFMLAAVLLVAGALLWWGHSFAADNVRTQLTQQKIFFPPAGAEAYQDPRIGPYAEKYAGQQVTNGDQAEVFANHYIAVHLQDTAGGKTYSEVSTLSRQNPDDAKLAGQVQTLFRGETLRGLLLNAYAFGTIAKIAGYAAWASFAGAIVMLLLSAAGVVHLRRTPIEAEVFVPRRAREAAHV